MPCRALPTLVAVAAALVAARAHAAGLELVEQSPEAVATAGAQTADADAAAAVYYNPAALAFQPGVSAQAGADIVVYRGDATPASPPSGAVSSTGLYATPTVFGGVRIAPRYAVGIGVFQPFAWSIAYPARWPGRFAGESLELRAVAVNPSVAMRFLPWLAVGFGIDVVPATLSHRHSIVLPDGTEGQFAADVSGTGVGGNAAILVRALPRWLDLAFAYRSAIDLDLSSAAYKTTLPLPHTLTFAAASHPLAGLTVTTDVRLVLWQDVRSIVVKSPDGTVADTTTLDYANSVGVRFGASYRFWRDAAGEPRLAARIGAGWEQGPTSAAATSPLLPDGDRALVGAGLGARFRMFSVDAGYLAAIASELFGASAGFGAAGSFAARYRSVTHTVSVALTLRLPNLLARD